jgi:hypothetical protein
LQYRVTEYAKKPDGSLKVDALRADDQCPLGQWLSTDGAAHQALPEHATLSEAHTVFHKASANAVRKADEGTLEEGSLGDKGELKVSFVRLCVAITKMSLEIG